MKILSSLNRLPSAASAHKPKLSFQASASGQIFAFAQNVHTYNNVIEDMRATLVEKADIVVTAKKSVEIFFSP